jgi:hypothetical protein
MRNHDSASLPLPDNRHGHRIEDGFGVDPVGAVKIQGSLASDPQTNFSASEKLAR